MMHWALPDPVLYRAYERFEQFLAERGEMKESRPFVRGGFWRNFMVKYPEINAMHKKMLRVSRRLHACERLLAHSVASSHAMSAHPGDARAIAMHGEREQPGAMIAGHGAGAAGRAADTALLDAQRRLADARDALWAAQCNCPYWHGVFGGLYLPHIRSQVFRNLIRAEGLLDGIDGRGAPRVESIDYDADGHPEILVETPELNAYFLPHSGGMAVALDLKHPAFNFLDTLTRREEGYHAQVRSAAVPGTMADGEARSIHDTVRAREAGLADRLVYDWHRKGGWIEHILAPSTTLDAFARAAWTDLGDFATQPWSASHEQDAEAISLRFERSGHIRHEGGEHALRLAKTFRFPCGSTAFTVTYEIDTEASLPQGLIFGVELNVNMLSGDAPDRYVEFGSGASRVPAGATGVAGSCTEVSVTNEWDDVRIAIGSDASFDLWHCPIETISLSEDGFERTYQGTTLVLRFPLATVAHTEYVLRHHLTSFR